MYRHLIVAIASLTLAACGGSQNTNTADTQQTAANTAAANAEPRRTPRRVGMPIEVKVKDSPTEFEPKSAYFFSEDHTLKTADGKELPTVKREIVVANYELDASGGRDSVMKKLTSPEQMRVVFQLVEGPEAEKERATTAGEFRLKANEPYSLMGIQVYTFAGGKEVKTEITPATPDIKGSVRVSSTGMDLVSGEIDITSPELTMFGSYIAHRPGTNPK